MEDIVKFQKLLDCIKVDKVIFACKRPRPVKIERIQRTDGARLLIPLAGSKKVLIGNGESIVKLNLEKGQVLCIPPVCWDRPLWESAHKMISVVFKEKYLRLIYINFNPKTDSEWPEPEFVYHLWPGPSAAAFHAMQTLINSQKSYIENTLLQSLLEILLKLIACDLRKTGSSDIGKALDNYLRISEYVQNNLQNQITREDIADIFHITPQYVSNLFKKFHGTSFSEFLTSTRIKHATLLLQETDMSVYEIALECNYSHTSHFIKMFKRHHGLSPAKFRIANK